MTKDEVAITMHREGRRARVTVSGKHGSALAEMETGGISELIQQLCDVRTQMKPPIPTHPDGARVNQVVNPVWLFSRDAASGAPVIGIRHPGLGWIVAVLSDDDRRKLVDHLTADHDPHQGVGHA